MLEQFGLTMREIEILQLIARGYGNKQIALDFHITEQSAKNCVSRILKKLGVVNRTEAVVKASQSGLISLDAETANRTAVR